MLDPNRFSTLEQLNEVLIPDSTLMMNALSLTGFGHTFSLIGNPFLKVNVLLDNGGLPLEFTPGNARVLDISEPFILPVNP